MTLFPLFLAALAAGQAAEEPAETPQRTTTAVVYGSDPCPTAQGDEIVVCARRPEGDRYRVPKELREVGRPLSERAWGSRTWLLEEAARDNLPGSCSVNGTGGQSGCHQERVDQWYAERRERRRQRR